MCLLIPYAVRMVIYATITDWSKQSLLLNLTSCMRPSEARKFADDVTINLNNIPQGKSNGADLARFPTFARYVLARITLNLKIPISNCFKDEQNIATQFLTQVKIDENLPSAFCQNREQYPRSLGMMLSYMGSAFMIPLGNTVRSTLV